MGRKRKSGGGNNVGLAVVDPDDVEAVVDERLDEQAEESESASNPDDEQSSGEGQPAQGELPAQEDGQPPSPTPGKPSPVMVATRAMEDCAAKFHAAEQLHNHVSLQYYAADREAKSLKKERDAALERLAELRTELDYLTARAASIKDAPAPLFEREIAGEWREFDLSSANIGGALAQHLIDADITKLGDIQAFTRAGKRLTEIAGIGPEGAAKVADLLAKFFEANPRYKLDGDDASTGDDGEPARIPSRVKVKGTISGDGYELTDGDEYDVLGYEDGAATVDVGGGCSADVPFGSYAVLAWRRKGAAVEEAAEAEVEAETETSTARAEAEAGEDAAIPARAEGDDFNPSNHF